MKLKLPPRVFEFFHLLFFNFVKNYCFPIEKINLISVACFLVACKVNYNKYEGRDFSIDEAVQNFGRGITSKGLELSEKLILYTIQYFF